MEEILAGDTLMPVSARQQIMGCLCPLEQSPPNVLAQGHPLWGCAHPGMEATSADTLLS